MNGIHVSRAGLTVSTDGRRLYAVHGTETAESLDNCIVPDSKVVRKVISLAAKNPVSFSRLKIKDCLYVLRFQFADCTILLKSIEGQYPRYTKVIPEYTASSRFGFNAPSVEFLERVVKLHGRNNPAVQFDGSVWHDVNNVSTGEYGPLSEAVENSDNITLRLNALYLLESVKLGFKRYAYNIQQPEKAIRSDTHDDMIIIMPMAI
jgi:DNA polymerase III sliding clamp (beta) subunit (PCNA family)